MHYIITLKRGKTPLNSIYPNAFYGGVKECISFSNRVYSIFASYDEAERYITYCLTELNEWYNKDVPEQAKLWSNNPSTPYFQRRSTFLTRTTEIYEKILSKINNMVIRKIEV